MKGYGGNYGPGSSTPHQGYQPMGNRPQYSGSSGQYGNYDYQQRGQPMNQPYTPISTYPQQNYNQAQ